MEPRALGLALVGGRARGAITRACGRGETGRFAKTSRGAVLAATGGGVEVLSAVAVAALLQRRGPCRATFGAEGTLETVLDRDALWDGIVMAPWAELAVHGALAVGVLADGARLARAIRVVLNGVRGLETAEGTLDADVDDGDAAFGEAALVLGPALGALWAFYARGAEHGVAAEGAVRAAGAEAAVGAAADLKDIILVWCATIFHVVFFGGGVNFSVAGPVDRGSRGASVVACTYVAIGQLGQLRKIWKRTFCVMQLENR